MQIKEPHFQVPRQSLLSRWLDTLPILFQQTESTFRTTLPSSKLKRALLKSQQRPTGTALITSSFIHIAAVLLLIRFPFLLLPPIRSAPIVADTPTQQDETIYYDLREVHIVKTFPSIESSRKAGTPATPSRPKRSSAKRVMPSPKTFDLTMTAPRPDNHHQTIIQPSTPPELRITHDVKLPNLLIGSVSAITAPEMRMDMNAPRSVAKIQAAVVAPSITDIAKTGAGLLPSSLPVLKEEPQLAVPVGEIPRPRMKSSRDTAKELSAGGAPNIGQSGGLLAISADPAELGQSIQVPAGNRYGSLSFSPAKPSAISASGNEVDSRNGNGGSIRSGESSSATAGSNQSGNGANGTGVHGIISVRGGSGSFSGAATIAPKEPVLAGSIASDQIFPVLTPVRTRGFGLQIYTGPTGGGGLAVYHVLPCNKIYTTLLPMPGKNWVLEYCSADANSPSHPVDTTRVVRLDSGLVAPDAGERYDFKRPEVPNDKRASLIVLKGAIESDGSVSGIQVLSGVTRMADRLAAETFRRWKFHPALRSGKPIRVQILVGIPAVER